MFLSVLIPVYNRSDDLRNLLGDLQRQTWRDAEIVVVDDGSPEPLAAIVAQFEAPLPVRYLRHETNRGVAAARNSGVSAARGQILVFIDSDSRVDDVDWLTKHAAVHTGKRALPKGIAGKDFVASGGVSGIPATVASRVFHYSNWFMSCMERDTILTDHHVPGNNISLRRGLVEEAGWFDESLRMAEDADICFRWREAGVALVYLAGLGVRHRDRETWGEVWRNYVTMGECCHRVRMKHPRSAYSALYPRNRAAAFFLTGPLVLAMTLYIWLRWLPRDPRVTLYLPGLLFANIAYGAGVVRSLFAGRVGNPSHNAEIEPVESNSG